MLNNGAFLVLMLRIDGLMDLSTPKEEGFFDNFRRKKGIFSVLLSLHYSEMSSLKQYFYFANKTIIIISTRSQQKDEKKQKKRPTKSAACVDLFDHSEIEYCCDVCEKSIEQVNDARKSKEISANDKHRRCKCQRP